MIKEINFENDLISEIQELSNSIGFKIATNKSFDRLLLDYLTVVFKIIERKKRTVFINPLFKLEIPSHPKRKEIEHLINLAWHGGNLNLFQSKRLLQTNFHDHLLNEWNIFHFHLSLKKEKKSKFFKQTDMLLFAYITDDTIVFLGVDSHKEGIFGDSKWVEILHDFFPNLIAKFKTDIVREINPKLNSIERQSLWNKGYTIPYIEVRGTIYFSPGLGRTLTGHGSNVVDMWNEMLRWIDKLKEDLHTRFQVLCDYLNISKDDAKFKIKFGLQTLEFYEETTNETLVVFPEVLMTKEEIVELIKTR